MKKITINKIAKSLHMSLSFLFLITLFTMVNAGFVYAREPALDLIDRIWTSDLSGNERTTFLPGESIRYNVDINISKESLVEVKGEATGIKEPEKPGKKEKKWKTKLEKRKVQLSAGKNTISWNESIPRDARTNSEAFIEIEARAKKEKEEGDDDDDDDDDDEDDKELRQEESISFTVGDASSPSPTPTSTPIPSPTPIPTPVPTPTLTPTNDTPTLGSIGNRSIDLGGTLSFTVTASDPNNDEISLFVTPIPLPDNATFDCGTGLFTFAPDITQAGTSFDLTFIASDRDLTDSETITITVNQPPANAATSVSGQVLDSITEEPLVGVTVMVNSSITTDENGMFTLTGVPPGQNEIVIDGKAATNQGNYPRFVMPADFIEGVNNVIERPIFLPKLDEPVQLDNTPETMNIVTSPDPNLNGFALMVEGGTAKFDNGTLATGISITNVPPDNTPTSLPDNLNPGKVITIQPAGVKFDPPASISFPNFDNLTPGSEVNLWSLNHDTGEFFISGAAIVSPDGASINTSEGGIVQAAWFFPLPSPAQNLDDPDRSETSENTENSCSKDTKSGFVIQTGNFFEDHTLPSYRSLGASKGLKFVYNSTCAFPCPIITTQTSLNTVTPVPIAISTSLRVGGVNFANESFKQGMATSARQSSMFDATSLDTGAYPYFLDTKSHYTASTVSNFIGGNVIVNNQINSPFGAGWTLDGLQKLHGLGRPDGRVLITEGNGSAKLFTTKFVGFSSSTSFPVGEDPVSIVTGDFNGDNVLDLATANFHDRNVSILLGDGTGNFSAQTNFTVGKSPFSIAISDFNGDNVLDLVTANVNDDHLSILLGDGTGNFTPSSDVPVAFSFSITTGDFNGDNVPDIATANSFSNNVSIVIGDGTGNFSTSTNFPVGGRPKAIATSDFNGDNVLDLVTGNSIDDNLSILLGNGTGNFSSATNFPVGDNPESVAIGDFNGDNAQDLATTNRNDGTVSILLGDGTGNFSAQTNFTVGNDPISIAIGDFNGDSVLDITTVLQFNDAVSILLGTTAPLGGPPGDFSTLAQNSDGTFTRTMKDGTQVHFDANGFHTSTVDRNGNTTTYNYDPNGILTTITDPAGLVTTLDYQNGLLSSVTDPVGRITTFQHDNNGNLTTIIDPDGTQASYTYDSRHLMTTETDPNGNTHTINYSFAGRFESMNLADGSIQRLSPSLQKGLVDLSSGIGDSVINPSP